MKLVRFKRNGQRLWRVTYGSDDAYLGRPRAEVWPKYTKHVPSRTEKDQRYYVACYAVKQIADGKDGKGFYFVMDGKAEVALLMAKVAMKHPATLLPVWSIEAMRAGWSVPEEWIPGEARALPWLTLK
jgi:hypothetical protein